MTTQGNGNNLQREEILDGFLYSYKQLDASAVKLYQASASIYALVELLVAKGIIGIEELDQRKALVENRLTDSFREADIGIKMQDPEIDKYSLQEEVKVDCKSRIHLCRGICCRLTFPLSWQDIQEGIPWNMGRPFFNARGPDGLCVHFKRETCSCGIYEQRPAICRSYDCRNDRRIWLDFYKMIINPEAFGEERGPQL